MTQEEKEEKRQNFMEWITFIDDRVSQWKKQLPTDIAQRLDWTVPSFAVLAKYVLENYTIEMLYDPRNKSTVDAMASYIGETYRLNFPSAKWYIELDEESDIFFNLPTVVTVPPAGAPISPFSLVFRIIHNKSGDILTRIFNGTISLFSRIKESGK